MTVRETPTTFEKERTPKVARRSKKQGLALYSDKKSTHAPLMAPFSFSFKGGPVTGKKKNITRRRI